MQMSCHQVCPPSANLLATITAPRPSQRGSIYLDARVNANAHHYNLVFASPTSG